MARIGGNPGNKGGGRKKLRDEIALIKYYESILPKVFSIVREKLDSKDEEERLWALEWLKTGIVKMIPQKIGGDPDNKIPLAIYGNISVQGYDINSQNIQPKKED